MTCIDNTLDLPAAHVPISLQVQATCRTIPLISVLMLQRRSMDFQLIRLEDVAVKVEMAAPVPVTARPVELQVAAGEAAAGTLMACATTTRRTVASAAPVDFWAAFPPAAASDTAKEGSEVRLGD